LIDLCELAIPEELAFDGISLAGLLTGSIKELSDRTQFLQYRQDTMPPEKWTNAVLTNYWRLIGGNELYNIKADPEQRHDLADQHPQVVARLRAEHEAWWAQIHPLLDQYCPISLGNDFENPTRLNAMDVMGDVAWNQTHIVLAQKSTGRWTVDVEQPGRYSFALRRWPAELGLSIDASVTAEDADSHIYAPGNGLCNTIHPTKALLKLFDQEWAAKVETGMAQVTFEVYLEQTGVTQLEAWFMDENGEQRGAYYVYVEQL
jgi:hypothetical protein